MDTPRLSGPSSPSSATDSACTSRPAPMSRTVDSATWLVTTTVRNLLYPPRVVIPPASLRRTSVSIVCVACLAGAIANNTPATHEKTIVTTITKRSRLVSSISASSGANCAGRIPAVQCAKIRPRPAPTSDTITLSTTTCRTSIRRLAPRAILTASSRRRAALLESRRVPALTQALKRSSPVAPDTTTLIRITCLRDDGSSRE